MNFQNIIDEISQEITRYFGEGKVANYIPALASVSPRQFGMAVCTVSGECFSAGDAQLPFSIQSISKVFGLTLAMRFEDERIWRRVGREPSGTSFNSLVQLEYEQGIPRNPFINAGALVITDIIMKHCENNQELMIDFVRELANNPAIGYNETVAASEKDAGYRNFALGHFLKSFGNIHGDVGPVLDAYFRQCSIEASCIDLARAFLFLANGGESPLSGKRIITERQAKRLNALMLTCGLYDEGGDFAFWVGLPGKSGVGGGIVAVLPKVLTVAVWSPELNPNHNSVCGMKALELFTTRTGYSIF